MGALRLLSTLGIVHLEPAGDGTFLRRRLVLVHLCALLPRWRKRGVAHGHNSASLHEVLRKPTCGGHTGQVLGYDYIDLENQDEYPWAFCLVFMEGVHDDLTSRYSEPFGCKPLTVNSLVHHQLKGATRGLQDGAAVDWAVTQTVKFLDTMDTGNESQHLAWLLRHAYHTGYDVRLTDRGQDVVGSRPGPYPAFRWHWKDVRPTSGSSPSTSMSSSSPPS